MQARARDLIAADDPPSWPRIGDMDAAVVRLEICRHLLSPLSDHVDAAPETRAAFDQIGTFLAAWTEERVQADAGRFCVETVRMLGTLLGHLERGSQVAEATPIGIAAA